MDLIRELWEEYGKLTAAQKRVVFEMFWNGYTEEETAETMGVSRSTVTRTLASAKKNLEKRLASVTQKTQLVSVLEVKATEGTGTEQGNGQRPDTIKAPVSNGPPASFCPPPDIYLGSPERNAFIKELSWIAAAPFLQLQGRGNYNLRARLNRERIARDYAESVEARKQLQAA